MTVLQENGQIKRIDNTVEFSSAVAALEGLLVRQFIHDEFKRLIVLGITQNIGPYFGDITVGHRVH